MMDLTSRIYIAGHHGLVGSAIHRNLLDVSRLHALGWRHKHSMHEGLITAYEDFLRNSETR